MNYELGAIDQLAAKVKLPIYLCIGRQLSVLKQRDEQGFEGM